MRTGIDADGNLVAAVFAATRLLLEQIRKVAILFNRLLMMVGCL